MVNCDSCGADFGDGAFCGECGAKRPEPKKVEEPKKVIKFCPHCGADVEPGVKFCGSCGGKVGETSGAGEASVAATQAVPAGIELGVGCYLTFSEASGGVLFTNFSETPIEGAFAFFSPGKPIPKFKFKQAGGKKELARGCAGPGRKKYFEGWTHFVKLCKSLEGRLVVFRSEDVALYFNGADSSVNKIEVGKWVEPRIVQDMKAVAAVPKGNISFNCSSLVKALFIETGRVAGESISL